MARPLRLQFPGAVYHLTARGNARQAIFLDDEDRCRFLSLLGSEVRQQGWVCHAYCLMGNHYHLLIETPRGNLTMGMRRLNGTYSQSVNRRHKRVGHLFQGRYHSVVVDREPYLLELCRYIVLNPVRAGFARAVRDWAWSSYRATAGQASPEEWLETDWLLAQFGADRKTARGAYRRFVREGLAATSPWEDLKGQIWLGDEVFLTHMESRVKGEPLDNVPRCQRMPSQPTRDEVLAAVCHVFGVREAKLLDRSNQEAFKAVVYLLRRAANLSLTEAASLSRVSPSRVSHIQTATERALPSLRLVILFKMFGIRPPKQV
ncbi:MAG: transposase [Deltaproteobacteria bacterium]|nr:transposase [Deltaproteobacteria bacterium]